MSLERLISLRENADLIQNEMSQILAVTQSNYSRWETGKEFIPLKKLNLLCNYFHVSADYLIGLSKNNEKCLEVELDFKAIGSRLRQVREANHLTQVELAQVLNTSQSTISAYEAGKTLVLTAFAFQICQTYKVSLDWIMGRKMQAKILNLLN